MPRSPTSTTRNPKRCESSPPARLLGSPVEPSNTSTAIGQPSAVHHAARTRICNRACRRGCGCGAPTGRCVPRNNWKSGRTTNSPDRRRVKAILAVSASPSLPAHAVDGLRPRMAEGGDSALVQGASGGQFRAAVDDADNHGATALSTGTSPEGMQASCLRSRGRRRHGRYQSGEGGLGIVQGFALRLGGRLHEASGRWEMLPRVT